MGILYPCDEWLMYRGATQHQALAVRIARGNLQSIEDDASKLRELSEGFDTLFLSSERFAGDLRSRANAARMATFRDALNRQFDQVEFVVAIRRDRRLLASMLKTKIVGSGMRMDATPFVREEMNGFYVMNRAIVDTLGEQLKVFRFESLVADPFPTSLFRASTGSDFQLSNQKRNASDERDPTLFLMSNVRILMFHVLGEPVLNTPAVTRAMNEIRRGIEVSPEVKAKLRDTLDSWIEKEVDAALADSNETLEDIYAPLLARAADN